MTTTKGQINKGTISLGTRNRQSKFSSLEVTNMIGGFVPVLDKENKVTEYRWNFISKVKLGTKANFRTGFVSCSIAEHEAIMKTLKLTEGDLKAGNEGYMKIVDAKGENAPRLQSLLDGLMLGENKFDSKAGAQIRIFSDIYAGVENAMYESKKHDCMMIRNEAVTKFGVRCFYSEDRQQKPIYVENRPFWTTTKDKNGKLVSDTSIKEALQMCNEADENGVTWMYDDKQFINPNDLVTFYNENDIVCTDLQSKIDDGIFSEVESAEFDWAGFDVASLGTLPDAKAFALEHSDFLGTIDPKGLDLAKMKAAIKKAVTTGLAAIESED